ncbi:hypothetical protein Q1695_007218 [Nippostrongylus brasiliensis]|nr:hypothetical protein Q1695_007218 [Nippostrongylus brasiliensis]
MWIHFSQKSPSQNKPVKPPSQETTAVSPAASKKQKKLSPSGSAKPRANTSGQLSEAGKSEIFNGEGDESVTVEGVVYVKKRRIGKGCSGSVFEVVRQDNNIAYALKEASLKRHEDIYREEVDRLLVLKSCQRIVKLIAQLVLSLDFS